MLEDDLEEISPEEFVDRLMDIVIDSVIMGALCSKPYVIIIVITSKEDNKRRTVFYWKYTSFHIIEPSPKIPFLPEETLV